MSAACLLVLLLPLVSAQTYHWGPCPNPGVQPGFNLQQVEAQMKTCIPTCHELKRAVLMTSLLTVCGQVVRDREAPSVL